MTVLTDHIEKQMMFSVNTFGPGSRKKGVIDHIGKELQEIADGDNDPAEWVDVWLLSMDGAWRCAVDECAELTSGEVAQMIEELRETKKMEVISEVTPVNVIESIRWDLNLLAGGKNDLNLWVRLNLIATLGLVYALTDEGIDVTRATDMGFTMIMQKQEKNERRVWPDWRTASADAAIEHVKGIED